MMDSSSRQASRRKIILGFQTVNRLKTLKTSKVNSQLRAWEEPFHANVIYYGNLIQSQTIDNEQSTTLMSTLALLNIF